MNEIRNKKKFDGYLVMFGVTQTMALTNNFP